MAQLPVLTGQTFAPQIPSEHSWNLLFLSSAGFAHTAFSLPSLRGMDLWLLCSPSWRPICQTTLMSLAHQNDTQGMRRA